MDHTDQAYVTLATNDPYCKGALVLAHSLRHTNTTRKLVIIIGPLVSENIRNALSQVFDEVIEVNVLDSKDDAHLALMKRPELGITFTKIHCWNLTQYCKCVFMDADTMVLQNIDDLFEREELSAAPDSGWPDIFNSGVFVYKPSKKTFKALVDMATAEGSFDGGDQGLLNTYFYDWAHSDIKKHLPFLYNLHITLSYTYAPAFKRFGNDAKVVHFLGSSKPWKKEMQQPQFYGFQYYCARWNELYNTYVRNQIEKKTSEESEQETHHHHTNGDQQSNIQLVVTSHELVGPSSFIHHHHHEKVEESFICEPHVDFSCSATSSDIEQISQPEIVSFQHKFEIHKTFPSEEHFLHVVDNLSNSSFDLVEHQPEEHSPPEPNISSVSKKDCVLPEADNNNNIPHANQHFVLHKLEKTVDLVKILPEEQFPHITLSNTSSVNVSEDCPLLETYSSSCLHENLLALHEKFDLSQSFDLVEHPPEEHSPPEANISSNTSSVNVREKDCALLETHDNNNCLRENQIALLEQFNLTETEKSGDLVENTKAGSVCLSCEAVGGSIVADGSTSVVDVVELTECEMSECSAIKGQSYDSYSSPVSVQSTPIDHKLKVEIHSLAFIKQVNGSELQRMVVSSDEGADLVADNVLCAHAIDQSITDSALQETVETVEEKEKRIKQERLEHQRAWETGYVDYLGRDSFDNILKHLNGVLK